MATSRCSTTWCRRSRRSCRLSTSWMRACWAIRSRRGGGASGGGAGALEGPSRGGGEEDRLVVGGVGELASSVDVIVLAQASMARATGGAAELATGDRSVPILTSPRLGVERLRDVVAAATK